MKPILVLYHKGCMDGFAAAYCAFQNYGDDAEYLPVQYGEPIPDLTDVKLVTLLDFSFPREQMRQIADKCSILVLDHHKTAEAALNGFAEECKSKAVVNVIFDMNKSGAQLAFDYFLGSVDPHAYKRNLASLINHIGDRDLWKFELPGTKEVSANLWSYDFITGEPKEKFKEFKNFVINSSAWIGDGVAILRYMQSQVNFICEQATVQKVGVLGWTVAQVNATNLFSEVGHQLCKLYPQADFSIYWFKRADGRYQYGLRSIGDFDVSKVARLFGGGGHKNAAGFELAHLLF